MFCAQPSGTIFVVGLAGATNKQLINNKVGLV